LLGKTQDYDETKEHTMIRHKDPRLCGIRAVAFQLFYRLEIKKEPFFDLSVKKNWYEIKLIRGGDPYNEIEYTTHFSLLKPALQNACVLDEADYSHVTHCGRKGAARMASLAGCSLQEVEAAGHWSGGTCQNSYLKLTPRPIMRALAGFKPTEEHSYYIPRDIEADFILSRQIFPDIEIWEKKFETKELQFDKSVGKHLN
jgi:hypothetical protein